MVSTPLVVVRVFLNFYQIVIIITIIILENYVSLLDFTWATF